ncbi:MAG TPA: carbon monoxide dehydrogenase subunit G [Pseudomonadales bacterium]
MEQTGEYRIQAGLHEVWAGLNDPDVLARCIDGCQSMEKLSDDRFQTSVKAKVGPVSATFQAVLTLVDVNAPSSYTIHADVKGGAAGFGKGTAAVQLTSDEGHAGATLLRYQVKANVGGKLAQIGQRLIDGAARKMADDFFAVFGEEVSGVAPEATGAAAPAESYERSGQWIIWLIVFGALALAMIFAI